MLSSFSKFLHFIFLFLYSYTSIYLLIVMQTAITFVAVFMINHHTHIIDKGTQRQLVKLYTSKTLGCDH